MEVVYLDHQERVPLSDETLQLIESAALQAARASGQAPAGTLNIALLDDEGIQGLNSRYLGHNWPTDVLAFPPGDDLDISGGPSLEDLGDIAISVETALRQAEEYGHSLEAELVLLVSHGVLHLLGYDDTPDRVAEMREKENEVLKALGFSESE